MCADADGSQKVSLGVNEKAKNKGCLGLEKPHVLYFSQKVWSGTFAYRKKFREVFLV